MSDEHLDIEQLLRRQMLRKPSASLDGRVQTILSPKAPAALRLSRWLAAMAACILIGAAVWPLVESAMRETPVVTPYPIVSAAPEEKPLPDVLIEHSWSQVTPGSIVHDEQKQPYRPYYVESIRQASWVEQDGSQVTVTYPETNIYYASLEVY